MEHKWKEYVKIVLGSLAVAVGIYYFWAPAQLAAGGISGLAIVVQSFMTKVPISMIVLGLDVIMFIIGFVMLGAHFGVKSIISSLSIAGCMRVFEWVTPEVAPLSSDLLVVLIFGALFISFGQALIFRQEASSGGTDIVAKIISKFTHLPIAWSLLIADLVVVILATGTFGIEKGLYAALGVILTTMMIDFFISGLSVEKYVVIIPSSQEKTKLFNDYILYTLERGATIYDACGAFSKEKKQVIATVVDRRQFILIKQYVQQIDPSAFVTVQNLHEVVGEGFKLKN
ncbi:MAG: YitT family protein [Cellulosilyticaceae bacterium]